MRFIQVSLACFLLPLLISGGTAAAQQSHIRVRVTDAYGTPVPAQITMTGNGLKREVRQDESTAVLYGRYTIEVGASGFSPARESFVVDQPEQALSIALKLGSMEGVSVPSCSVIGHVTPETAAARIRLVQLYGTYSVDVAVRSDGAFAFRGVDCGDYMLIAMGAKECLGTMTLRAVPTAGPTDMRLTPGKTCTSVGR